MSTQTVQASQHSGSWIAFTYASFFGALGMVALGILFAPVDFWIKAYFAHGRRVPRAVVDHHDQDAA